MYLDTKQAVKMTFPGDIGPPLSFAHEHKWQTVLSGGSRNTFPLKANANR